MNILAWVMDEASAFRAAGGMQDNSGAVYQTCRTSANSRFASMRWIGIIISFPRKQVNDFTYDKYKEAQTSPTMYGDTGATWDINPQYDETHPLFKNFEWVTITDLNVRVPKPFVEEFLKNPTDCKTKYMCQPPPQLGGFFEIPHLLDDCVDRDLPGIVSTQQVVTRIVREMEFSYVSRVIDQMPARQEGCYYTMHGDPGLVSDAFSICVCHTLPESKTIVDSNGDDVELRRVVVDFVLNWEPTSTTPVDLRNVEDVMESLARYYGIQRITFDRWNSATSIQNLIEKGFFAEDMSFSNAMQIFRNLKLLAHNSFITWPDNPDLLDELKFLKLENNKITHDAFGKDRADALAGAVWSATGEELSDTQKLVMETLGEIMKDRNANGGVATINWKF